MFLREAYEIILKGLESNLRTYGEDFNDLDADYFVQAMEAVLKSMYFNQV